MKKLPVISARGVTESKTSAIPLCLVRKTGKDSMKITILLWALIFIPFAAHGDFASETQYLNPALVPIYKSLVANDEASNLEGTFLDLTLKLKHASEKHLLFYDTQIAVDQETRYYLIKWKFSMDDIKAILDKTNVTCRVKGKIVEVVKGATTPGMPYIVVELSGVEL